MSDALIQELNAAYDRLHRAREELFWTTRMGTSSDYAAFNGADAELRTFKESAENLAQVRAALAAASGDRAETLRGWVAFFEANGIEKPEGKKLAEEITEAESALQKLRKGMALGYVDPATGHLVRASSVELALKISSHDDERTREACFRGLESIESFVLNNGFLEIVKLRNRFARALGYEDFYDYKVRTTEGIGKTQLFAYLDELEQRTREAGRRVVDGLGPASATARQPWNFRFRTQGDAIKALDPFMPFSEALARWGRSFSAMGVRFMGAELQLDLLDRPGKYENGFCHAPAVPYRRVDGSRVKARVNFTSNAVPGQRGSGHRAAETLFHEGGHAAHFSNVLMGAPCFSQEFAPSSAAMAETQSMFFDSLLGDGDWMVRYAGVPWDVIERVTLETQPLKATALRNLLVVAFAERALYGLADTELTADRVLSSFTEIERRLTFLERCPRPTLAVPHLLDSDSSAIYHGYILAEAAVAATRAAFVSRHGHIVDNPRVGPELTEAYWRPGNSRRFVDFIASFTGSPYGVDALVADVTKTPAEAAADQRLRIAKLASVPVRSGPVELDAELAVVHGANVVASTRAMPFEEAAGAFKSWVESQRR
jgi:Zn-dependent oligopeptidase